MDTLESGKDTQLPKHQRPKRLTALSHFFIVIGVFLLSLITMYWLGGVIALLIQGLDISIMSDQEALMDAINNTTSQRIVNLFGSAGAMLLAAFITTKLIKADTITFLSLDRLGKLKWVGLSIVFFVVCLPLMQYLLLWNQSVDFSMFSEGLARWIETTDAASNRIYEVLIGAGTTSDLLINIVLMAIIPALAEEFLFRGLLLKVFHGLFKNIHVAIVVTAILFAALHLQLPKMLPMMFLAIVMGYLVYWTGSLWPAIIVHFANNAMAVFAMHFQTDGSYDELVSNDTSVSLMLVIPSLIAAIVLFIYMQKKSTPKLENFYV